MINFKKTLETLLKAGTVSYKLSKKIYYQMFKKHHIFNVYTIPTHNEF